VEDEVDAGEEVDEGYEDLPDTTSGSVSFEGEDKVGDTAEDHHPAEEESDGYAGDEGEEQCDESGDDEKDAEGDGPVDGLGDEGCEGGWAGAHMRPPEVVDTRPRVGRRIS
jgi:hypothetical protein